MQLLRPPFSEKYKVSSLIIAEGTEVTLLPNQKLDCNEAMAFVGSLPRPLVICEIHGTKSLGRYTFIDQQNQIRSDKGVLGIRSEGLHFLRQLFEEATSSSPMPGSGVVEIYPLERQFDSNKGDLITGRISHYFTRANHIIKQLCGVDLREFGVYRESRRDRYSDEFGNALPRYGFKLNISICVIRHTEF